MNRHSRRRLDAFRDKIRLHGALSPERSSARKPRVSTSERSTAFAAEARFSLFLVLFLYFSTQKTRREERWGAHIAMFSPPLRPGVPLPPT